MTARDLLARWQDRDIRYSRRKRAMTQDEIAMVRDYRYREARAAAGGDELRSLAVYWVAPR